VRSCRRSTRSWRHGLLGTQRVESDPERTVEGVFAMWYGKGPGVDRAGDALKHGNAYGSSPHGGVLVVAGDDHGCVSSSMPHQSTGMHRLAHAGAEPVQYRRYARVRLYGWALSRFSGAWVGYKAISETVESGSTVDLDAFQTVWPAPKGFIAPEGGPAQSLADLPSLDDRGAAGRPSSTPCGIRQNSTPSTNGSRRVRMRTSASSRAARRIST
jgi:indolepyruvate ferredoxin oxidoreductase